LYNNVFNARLVTFKKNNNAEMKKLIVYYTIFVGVVPFVSFFLHKSEDPNWAFVKEEGAWVLKQDGNSFFIRGAVMHHKVSRPELLKKIGGNVVRIEANVDLIREAYDSGLYAYVNLPILHQRDGMDWDCEAQVKELEMKIIEIVNKLKHHPGILMWSLGNEHAIIPGSDVNEGGYNKNVWEKLDKIAKKIKKVDPDHFVGYAVSLSNVEQKLSEIVNYSQNLDYIGLNAYDEMEDNLFAANSVWKKPILITEWGINGWWSKNWKGHRSAREESTSFEKSRLIGERCRILESSRKLCVGGIVFFWGDRDEQSSTYWGLLHEDRTTDSIGALATVWGGDLIRERSLELSRPNIENPNGAKIKKVQFVLRKEEKALKENESLSLGLEGGQLYEASVFVENASGREIDYSWEIRNGLGKKVYGKSIKELELLEGLIVEEEGPQITFRAPKENGIYRLHAFAAEGENYVAYSNVIFTVGRVNPKEKKEIDKKFENDLPTLLPCNQFSVKRS